ncbi:MAG TPA: hypothetical protein DEF45_07295 [Rhodopirellula sp.]|nr:hypothetical protein [Rhodopirellula sp.]
MNTLPIHLLAAVTTLGMAIQASAQSTAGDSEIEEIVVIGDTVGSLGLDSDSSTGSRLGLTIRETPAAIDVISKEVLRSRGYQKLTDAVQSLPGVISGNHPAAPSTFSMRGFTRGQVSILRDGLWVGPSSMVMRPKIPSISSELKCCVDHHRYSMATELLGAQ